MRIKKGDQVEVISGANKGERGEVLRVIPRKQYIVVENIKMVKKHQKPQQAATGRVTGGIIEFEAPIHASNVMLVCPQTDQPTRVGIRRDEDGNRIRFSKRSGQDID